MTKTDRITPREMNEIPINQNAYDLLVEEYKALQQNNISLNGIHVIPSSDTWKCIMFLKDGTFDGTKLVVNLKFPNSYPNDDVKVHFETKILHPIIDSETGEFNIKVLPENMQKEYLEIFSEKSSNKIEKILLFIKNLFSEYKIEQANYSLGRKKEELIFLQEECFGQNEAKKVNLDILNKKKEQDLKIINDIKEVLANLAKCQGELVDKSSVLIDNVLDLVVQVDEQNKSVITPRDEE